MPKPTPDGDNSVEDSDSSHTEEVSEPAGSVRKVTTIDGAALLTPRMRAERIVIGQLQGAENAIEWILGCRGGLEMADAIALKTQSALAVKLIEYAQNIGEHSKANAAGGGMQLSAANIVPGALATLLAQRNAARKNTVRIVEAKQDVQPTAAEADGGIDKT